MAEVRTSRAENYLDITVEAEFAHPLVNNDVLDVVQIVSTTLSRPSAAKFFDRIIALNISTESLVLRLRYYLLPEDSPSINPQPREDANALKMQFVLYILAHVDESYRLGSVPFPTDFREILDIRNLFER